jgi:ribosomal protein S14
MTVRTQERCSEAGSYANLPVLRKIAIIRVKFRVHPGNPGYTETPLYT